MSEERATESELTSRNKAAVMDPPPWSPMFLMSAMEDLIFFLYFLFKGMGHTSSPDLCDMRSKRQTMRTRWRRVSSSA
jgi:hypothetical protein